MKQHLLSLILTMALMFIFSVTTSTSQEPPPPPPPGSHGETGNQDPRGAPIDGGLGILLALGAGYGGYKFYRMKRKEKEDAKELKTEN
ncbi:MAG: hypothetical protein JXA23_03640 [Bacteroidales bacterium]|nr:hypothetical protein [Bacteroidales bacterium]